MATKIIQYKIFLATPSDVTEEREKIEKVISKLNETYGARNDLHLKLVKWETDSTPGIAMNHPQDLISPLVDECDIFIGILWKRFGSPTYVADSGTEEEFLRAYNNFYKSTSANHILFYFSLKPIPPNELDIEQFKKIKEFKEGLAAKKVLYSEYKDIEELIGKLEIHIPNAIEKVRTGNKESTDNKELININNIELGVLDYVEIVEDNLQISNSALCGISDATEWIGEQLTRKASEIEGLTMGGNRPGRKTVSNLMKRVSKIMDNYANRIEPEISVFYEHFEKAMDAISQNIEIMKNDLEVENSEYVELIDSLDELDINVTQAISDMIKFEETLDDLPRISRDLNISKANVSNKLNKLIENLKISLSMVKETKNLIKE